MKKDKENIIFHPNTYLHLKYTIKKMDASLDVILKMFVWIITQVILDKRKKLPDDVIV